MDKNRILAYFEGNWAPAYDRFVEKLKESSGGQAVGLCPFHADSDPSLSVKTSTGVFKCFGCGAKGDFFSFYARLKGLDTNGGFSTVLEEIGREFGLSDDEPRKSKGEIRETYDYIDERGELVFQVVRMEPKDFRQRRPDGKGGWTWSVKGVRQVPYNLPAVVEAEEVIVVEGEKDVETARKLGLTATCNAGGSGKWQDKFSALLEGKDVVLIPDNDDPGRDHMKRVASSLEGKARSVKWLDLPDLPPKGDLSDWVRSFDDEVSAGERLAILIEGAEEYAAERPVTWEDAILLEDDFLSLDVPEKRSFLRPWLTEQSIILMSGYRGIGKTWAALGVIDAITTGTAFGPWEAGDPVPCMLVDGELPIPDIKERMWSLNRGVKRKAPFYVASDAYANTLGLPRAHLANSEWRSFMKASLVAKGIKLLVLDNLASLSPGLDENSKQDWDPINQWLLELRFAGISTLMLHHVNKSGDQRGISSREDNIDTSIILKQPPGYVLEDGCRFVLSFTKARVRDADKGLISETELAIQYLDGGSVWTWGNVKVKNRDQILKRLDEGASQADVANELGVDKSYVSRVRRQAIKDGILSEKNKLTQKGFSTVSGLGI